jgi:hypothetical protein
MTSASANDMISVPIAVMDQHVPDHPHLDDTASALAVFQELIG